MVKFGTIRGEIRTTSRLGTEALRHASEPKHCVTPQNRNFARARDTRDGISLLRLATLGRSQSRRTSMFLITASRELAE